MEKKSNLVLSADLLSPDIKKSSGSDAPFMPCAYHTACEGIVISQVVSWSSLSSATLQYSAMYQKELNHMNT